MVMMRLVYVGMGCSAVTTRHGVAGSGIAGAGALVAECCFELLEGTESLGKGFGPLCLRVCCHGSRNGRGSVHRIRAGRGGVEH